MKFQKPIAIAVGAALGCQLSTGCAWDDSQSESPAFTTPMPLTSNAQDSAPAPVIKSNPQQPEPVAFTSTTPIVAVNNNPVRRPTQLVNLFGEINDLSPNAGSPLDGGSNLAQITFATEGACVDPDVDRSGTWIAFASTMHRNTSDLYIKATHGKTLTQITTDPADDVMPAFSPDAKSIAFASNRAGNWDIFAIGIDGSNTVQLSNDTDHELHPTWSPDGKMIAYCKFGGQSQRWEIWTVDAANPGVRNFLDYGVFPQWCPDPTQNKILFQRAKQRGSRDYSIWTIDIVDGQAKYPTEVASAANAALINPAWAPDGSRVVFVTVIDPTQAYESHPGQSDLWIVNIDGTERTSLTNGESANFQPVWASNGTVFFVSDRSGSDNIWSVAANAPTYPVRTQTVGVTSADASSAESHP